MKSLLLFVVFFCVGCVAAEPEYAVHHDGRTGKVVCILRERDKAAIPITVQNRDYVEFLRWDAAEKAAGRPGLVVADREPDPVPTEEIERQRRLAVAITYLRTVPEAWENGTNDQKIMWAIKQVLREIKSQVNEE